MENHNQRDVEIALRMLEKARERQRRCYYNHQEDRKARRREAYAKKKLEKEGQGGISV